MPGQVDEVWIQAYAAAETKFHKLARKSWRDGKDYTLQGALTAADIREQLDIDHQKLTMDDDRKRHSGWTSSIKVILKPVEMLGNMVAGTITAAMPGSPSGLACNALLYLIQTGQVVSKNYDTLGLLFQKIAQFISRFEIYDRQAIPEQLVSIIHQVLISYIIICGLSIRLVRKSLVEKYAEAFLFGEDSDINAQLSELDKLTKFESSMVGALTYDVALATRERVESLFNDWPEFKEDLQQIKRQTEAIPGIDLKVGEVLLIENRKELNSMYQKQINNMQELLKPKATALNRAIFLDLEKDQIPEAGMWLRKEDLLKSWLRKDHSMLAIHGSVGTGKTHLAYSIVQDLMQNNPQGQEYASRVSVVYHFWRSNSPELRKLNEALRGLAYAIARNDRKFANYFHENCTGAGEVKTAQQLWEKLFLGFFCETELDNRAYLLIDGLDQAEPSEREEFLKLLKTLRDPVREKKCRIQVLLVERPQSDRTLKEVLGFQIPTIRVNHVVNEADIRLYVTQKLNETRLWYWVSDLRQEIIDSLTASAHGNFSLVDYAIGAIKDLRRPDEIRDALRRSPQSLPDAILHDLLQLGELLDPTEVTELIELLTWAICGMEGLTLAQLAILLVKDGEEAVDPVYLERQLRTRYQDFLTVVREDRKTTEDLERLQADSLNEDRPIGAFSNDLLNLSRTDRASLVVTAVTAQKFTPPALSQPKSLVIRSNPQTSRVQIRDTDIEDFFRGDKERVVAKQSGIILETEVNIVRNVLKLVCGQGLSGQDLYDRFEFEDFFAQKLRRQNLSIDVDPKTASLKVLTRVLAIISGKESLYRHSKESSKSLFEYAVKWFPEHVGAVDKQYLEPDQKMRIAGLLISIFREEDAIERWAKDNDYLVSDWLNDSDNRNMVIGWISESTVLNSLSELDQQWITGQVLTDSNHLLQPTIAIIAREWLQRDEWDVVLAYQALSQYHLFGTAGINLDGSVEREQEVPEAVTSNGTPTMNGDVPSSTKLTTLQEGAPSNDDTSATRLVIPGDVLETNSDKSQRTDNGGQVSENEETTLETEATVKHGSTLPVDDGMETSKMDFFATGADVSEVGEDDIRASHERKSSPEEDDEFGVADEVDNILKVARWTGFNEDSMWYTRVAWTILRTFFEGEKAVAATFNYFERAIKEDDKNWSAQLGLATAYCNQSRWATALDVLKPRWTYLAKQSWWTEDHEKPYGEYLKILGTCHTALKQHAEATEAYREILRILPKKWEMMPNILANLRAQDKFSEILELLQQLEGDVDLESGMSRLTECLHYLAESSTDPYVPSSVVGPDYVFRRCAFVAARLNEGKVGLDFLRTAVKKAIEVANNRLLTACSAYLHNWLGWLLLEEYGDSVEAEKVLSAAMDMTAASGYSDLQLTVARRQIPRLLAKIYVDNAGMAQRGSAVAEENIRKLTKLAPPLAEDKAAESATLPTNLVAISTAPGLGFYREVSLVLGFWYSFADKDREKARAHLRSHVKLGIDLLSDDNPNNDYEAYDALGLAFIVSGDDDNARAACSLLDLIGDNSVVMEIDNTTSAPTLPGNVAGDANLGHPEQILAAGEQDIKFDFITETAEGPTIQLESTSKPQDAPTESLLEAKAPEFPTLEARPQAESTADETGGWFCDGDCGKRWASYHDMYVCRVCLNVSFDERCKTKVQNGTMDFKICNPKHIWFYVPKPKERVPPNMVRVGEKLLSITDWRDAIREDWMIEEQGPVRETTDDSDDDDDGDDE